MFLVSFFIAYLHVNQEFFWGLNLVIVKKFKTDIFGSAWSI